MTSLSECHLCIVRRWKHEGIEFIWIFSVESSITIKENYSGIPKKEISLCQPLDIVKLDLVQRKQQDIISILLFSIKADGDISYYKNWTKSINK
jgi:hypothetical protein